tara:strand:- start:336 stop:626 length:291 start_codon:yes stop_codon:yes gene_type:complete
LAASRELLKEVTIELWKTVKKLRPELDKQTRLQLVLKALITIGDLPDHVEAAMVVGICAELEISESDELNQSKTTNEVNSFDNSSGRKVVRRSSAK